jgi:transposase
VISGILHILKTGGRWRDVPPEYGPAKTIYNRYTRWARRGVWQRIFAKLAAAGPIPDELALDSSNVKAHRSASGGKGGSSVKRSASRAAAEQRKSIVWPMVVAGSLPSR